MIDKPHGTYQHPKELYYYYAIPKRGREDSERKRERERERGF